MKNFHSSFHLATIAKLTAVISIATACNGAPAWTNPVIDGADPDVLVENEKFWIYPSKEPNPKNMFFAYQSKDLQHWVKSAPILKSGDIRWLNDDKAPSHELWAPGIFKESGKYFLYYAVGPQNPTPSRIGVATATTPDGPFSDSGEPIVTGDSKFEAIDPMVFQDPISKKVYLYCGGSAGPEMRVYELTDDRLHVAKRLTVDTPKNFTEGPFMHARDDKFYLSYSYGKWNDDSYSVAYSTSNSPLGPWTYHGQILQTDKYHSGPGHHSIFQNPGTGEWFIAYHRWNNAKRDGKMPPIRTVSIERLNYDKEGLLKSVEMTNDGPPSSLTKRLVK